MSGSMRLSEFGGKLDGFEKFGFGFVWILKILVIAKTSMITNISSIVNKSTKPKLTRTANI